MALLVGACTSTVMDSTPQNPTAGGAGGGADQGSESATGGHAGKRIVVCNYADGLAMWPSDMPLPNSDVICSPNQCCGHVGEEEFDCCDPTTEMCNINGLDNDPKCELLGAGGSGSTSTEPSGSGGSDTTTTTDSSSFGGSST